MLALLAQRPAMFDLLRKDLGKRALAIAKYIVGLDKSPAADVRTSGDSIKAWAEQRAQDSLVSALT
jgi:hypothetical protein